MEVEGILAPCVEVFIHLNVFILSLTHTHCWCMFGMCLQLQAGLIGELQQLLSCKQDSITSIILCWLTTGCLGTCWHTHTHSCTHKKLLLLGNPLAICFFILLCQQQIREGGKSKIQQQILAYADKGIPDSVVTLTRSSLKSHPPPCSLHRPRSPPPTFSHSLSQVFLHFLPRSLFSAESEVSLLLTCC